MAGTIFGLGLSQRVDLNAKPSVGWLLYIYAANSSTPSNTFQDTALTVPNPWPIAADAMGTMPQFWMADGSYRARATNADASIVYFDIPSAQSLGPSAGSAPSGGVDPTAIFQTGDVIWIDVQGTRTGWVRDNARTIGSATSGATERANADCQALFEFLWNSFSDTLCPVLTGRGVSAAADWSANKQITTPDKRAHIVGGLSDMGNTDSGFFANAPVQIGTGPTSPGTLLGEAQHTLTTTEAPSGLSTLNFSDPGHTHVENTGSSSGGSINSVDKLAGTGSQTSNVSTASATTGISASLTDNGGDGAHNNVQATIVGTFYRKL